jgi:hypothetical protein
MLGIRAAVRAVFTSRCIAVASSGWRVAEAGLRFSAYVLFLATFGACPKPTVLVVRTKKRLAPRADCVDETRRA